MIMCEGQAQKTFSVWGPDSNDEQFFLMVCKETSQTDGLQVWYHQGAVGDLVRFWFLAANVLKGIKLAVAKTKGKKLFSPVIPHYITWKKPIRWNCRFLGNILDRLRNTLICSVLTPFQLSRQLRNTLGLYSSSLNYPWSYILKICVFGFTFS